MKLLLTALVATSQLIRSPAHASIFLSVLSMGATQTSSSSSAYPIYASDDIMGPKAHGTCPMPVQEKLRWSCDRSTADRICCTNRHYAEHSSYWQSTTLREEFQSVNELTFYDSVTGKPLFVAPRGRSKEEFLDESEAHGWPSFRDPEVVWENVRCLNNGEAVSVDGTHLGHNLPDELGNRYCINIVSVAGTPFDAGARGGL